MDIRCECGNDEPEEFELHESGVVNKWIISQLYIEGGEIKVESSSCEDSDTSNATYSLVCNKCGKSRPLSKTSVEINP